MFRFEYFSPQGEKVVFAIPEHAHGPNWDNPHLLTVNDRTPEIEEVAYWHLRWGGNPDRHRAIWREAKRAYERHQKVRASSKS